MRELIMFTVFCLIIYFSAVSTAQSCGGQGSGSQGDQEIDTLTIYPTKTARF